MKSHGLWRFHHEARRVRELFPTYQVRWWIDSEIERVYRMIECVHSGYGRTAMFSNADAIVRCARRFARLYKQSIQNVGQWNALCERIAGRCGFTHSATMKSCLVNDAPRQKSIIHFSDFDKEIGRPNIDRDFRQVMERAARLASVRRQLIHRHGTTNPPTLLNTRFRARHCAVCGNKKTYGIDYLPCGTKALNEALEPI